MSSTFDASLVLVYQVMTGEKTYGQGTHSLTVKAGSVRFLIREA